MTLNLTEQQKLAIQNGNAVRFQADDLDLVIVRADIYDRVKRMLYDGGDWNDNELRKLLAKSSDANGWNGPEMDAYDNYGEEIAKQCR